MNENKLEQLINILYTVAVIAVLMGTFFRLQHYPYGYSLIFVGFTVGTIAAHFQIKNLKKTIKKLEERKPGE